MKLGCLLALGLVLLPLDAAAQSAAPADSEEPALDARSLFMQGQEAYARGEYEAAIDLWQRAYALDPRPGLLYNLAQAYGRLGRVEEERDALLRFIDAGDPGDPVVQQALARVETLRERLARTSLEIIGAPDGSEVRIDGETRGTAPLEQPLRVSPGRHEVEVELHGFETFVSVVVVPAGESTEVPVTLRPGRRADLRGVGYGLLGGGGALVVVGGVLGGVAYAKSGGAPRGSSDADAAETLALVSDISVVAGAAAAATGLVMVLVSEDEEEVAVSATPMVVRGGAGAALVGRF